MSNTKVTENSANLGEKMLCAGAAACTADIITFPLDVRVKKKRFKILVLFKPNFYRIGRKSSFTNSFYLCCEKVSRGSGSSLKNFNT